VNSTVRSDEYLGPVSGACFRSRRYSARRATWLFAAVALGALLALRPAAAQVIIPLDVNCDGLSSAADLTAAVIVSYDANQLPGCVNADPFRNRPFTDEAEAVILDDIYNRRAPEWTPTPTPTNTFLPTPTLPSTLTPTITATVTLTATPAFTPTPSPSVTVSPTTSHTPPPSATRTPAQSSTPTPTHTPTATRTPTGLAQKFAGTWQAIWANGAGACCYLIGQPAPLCVYSTTYEVTAAPDNQLTIVRTTDGQPFGTATVDGNGNVQPLTVNEDGGFCNVDQQEITLQYVYTFTLNTNGTGSAQVDWKRLTHCQACDQHDNATLQRVGP
jgi:hypothetical protein